jgi:hypothetical protein
MFIEISATFTVDFEIFETMNRFPCKIFLLCLILIPLIGLSQEAKLISFEMKDQFKKEYSDRNWPDSILIILGSDREGSEYNPIWAQAISDSLQTIPPGVPVKLIGLADLKGAPFFLRGFISNMFPGDPDQRILMDWEGSFAGSYNFIKGESNILIFDLERNLVYQTSGKEPDKIKLSEILALLRRA